MPIPYRMATPISYMLVFLFAAVSRFLEERRRIMAKQAERMAAHYENDREWRNFQGGDFIAHYASTAKTR